ncbi:MAG: single-stranded-DNA-specific exonuclease RecJ [Minisyncoccia bacterium]
MSKKYLVREVVPKKIEKSLESFSPFVQSLLYARGIEDEISAYKFLNPNYDTDLYDPYLLEDMKKAVKRILGAISKEEKIVIFSDYDADGIPGAVALHDFFKKIEFYNFINYIPLRNEEGFGLNHEAIYNLAGQKVKLIITIDCGITDVDQVETANQHGIDVIITDHHTPHKKIPKAFAIVNPKQKTDKYPDKNLCGSGVIFKVIQAIIISKGFKEKFSWKEGQEKWLLDMVGLATLSDMVPLLGENRVLSYYGLKVFQKSPRVGIQKLLALLKTDQRTITEDDLAFMVTPRINAASRMGIPRDAFTLLSTTDEAEAGVLADHLNKKNDERKGVVGSMVKEIKKKLEDSDEDMKHVLVFGNPEWKPSLLGLVANSFSDEHNRPVFFWGRNSTMAGEEDAEVRRPNAGSPLIKGSCRAGGETDIVKLMEKVKDIFVDYGGHKGAGGFSILQENVHHLEERLNIAYLELVKEHKVILDTLVDKKLSLDDVNWETWKEVEKFTPFGFENPKPLFLFENIKISNVKLFGKEQNHLELKFKNSHGKDVTAIVFFQNGDKFETEIKEGSVINLVANLEKSVFRNYPELRLRIIDIY